MPYLTAHGTRQNGNCCHASNVPILANQVPPFFVEYVPEPQYAQVEAPEAMIVRNKFCINSDAASEMKEAQRVSSQNEKCRYKIWGRTIKSLNCYTTLAQ
jgi:hypothetical protein